MNCAVCMQQHSVFFLRAFGMVTWTAGGSSVTIQTPLDTAARAAAREIIAAARRTEDIGTWTWTATPADAVLAPHQFSCETDTNGSIRVSVSSGTAEPPHTLASFPCGKVDALEVSALLLFLEALAESE